MKKFTLVVLLVVCLLSSFIVAHASVPPDNGCPQCGSYDIGGETRTYSVAQGTIPCSHHLGYTDTIYEKYSATFTYCRNCGYNLSYETTLIGTYVKCGYDGRIYTQ